MGSEMCIRDRDPFTRVAASLSDATRSGIAWSSFNFQPVQTMTQRVLSEQRYRVCHHTASARPRRRGIAKLACVRVRVVRPQLNVAAIPRLDHDRPARNVIGGRAKKLIQVRIGERVGHVRMGDHVRISAGGADVFTQLLDLCDAAPWQERELPATERNLTQRREPWFNRGHRRYRCNQA